MSLWEKIKSLFSKKQDTPMLDEGENVEINSRDRRASFVQGLDAREDQKIAEARQRQFCMARDVIDAMQTRWKNDNITAKEGLEILLNSRGYPEEEIVLDKLEIDILNRIGIQSKNISQDTLDYFKREDMQRLVENLKDMSIQEAAKFQYTKDAANRFIPDIPSAMKTIMDREIEEKQEAIEENQI